MIGGKLIRRLAEYFSDGWRREGLIDSSCLFKIGAEVRAVRWKISNNTHPVPVLNNTHPFPSKCSVDALCRVRESVRFASERSRVRVSSGPPSSCTKKDAAAKSLEVSTVSPHRYTMCHRGTVGTGKSKTQTQMHEFASCFFT